MISFIFLGIIVYIFININQQNKEMEIKSTILANRYKRSKLKRQFDKKRS